jgi:2-oxoglutarate dehydrogenase E2 component (dihydrolipoamide succinyltransferase)
MTQIIVPPLGESVTEAVVAKWLKQAGDAVAADETVVELETDKVTVEVNAPAAGVIDAIAVPAGGKIGVGGILGSIKAGAPTAAGDGGQKTKPAVLPPAQEPLKKETTPVPGQADTPTKLPSPAVNLADLSPAVRKLIEENRLDPAAIPASGKDGRLSKGDVLGYLENRPAGAIITSSSAVVAGPAPALRAANPNRLGRPDREERVRMTRLRVRIAERLKEAQNTAAMLTTFNEVDMSAMMATRNKYKEIFEKKHGARLGFMSFFTKAAINALREFPAVNAEIDGEDIVYKHYYDIGVAVSTPNGLVVPVLRDADQKSFAQIEAEIVDKGKRASEGKLGIDEMQGGTFTITNGGVFGSLMSTPIINPPQVAILGMHAIKERPVVVGGQIVIRPMMYVALSYDHRIIDGREAVSFLVRIKDAIEDPERLLLGV